MKTPGFTAEASLYKTSGNYDYMAMRDYGKGPREVISQLKGSVFHRPFGGGTFGTIEDYWTCRQGCETAYSACLDTCEGTIFNPKPSSNCTICDQDYQACLQGCSRDIA